MSETSRRLERLFPLILAVVSALLYAGALSAGFTYDDHSVVMDNRSIQYWHFWDIWGSWNRAVRQLTLMADYAFFGDAPAGYHLHSLLWHALCSVLFYLTVRRISGEFAVAAFAGLLFAVHPIHVEAVASVANRKEPLSLAFSLVMFLAYLRFQSVRGSIRWAWLVVAAAGWGLALFSKQVAIVMPLVLAVYEYCFVAAKRRLLASYLPALVLLSAVVGSLMLLYLLQSGLFNPSDLASSRSLHGYAGELSLRSVALTSAPAFWRYVGLLIWPSALCPDHKIQLAQSLFEPMTLLAWLGALALAVLGVFLVRRKPLVAFGLLWFLIAFLPVSNLLPIAYILADRYMYAPSAGFLLFVVACGRELHRSLSRIAPPLAVGAVGAVGLLLWVGYSLRTVIYTGSWHSEETLWRYTLTCNPRSHMAYDRLGIHYHRAGQHERALEHYEMAIRLGYVHSHCNRGAVLFDEGDYAGAVEACSRTLRSTQARAWPYYMRGRAFRALGKLEPAIADLDQALRGAGSFTKAYYERGLAHKELGHETQARADLERAAKLGSKEAREVLASWPPC